MATSTGRGVSSRQGVLRATVVRKCQSVFHQPLSSSAIVTEQSVRAVRIAVALRLHIRSSPNRSGFNGLELRRSYHVGHRSAINRGHISVGGIVKPLPLMPSDFAWALDAGSEPS